MGKRYYVIEALMREHRVSAYGAEYPLSLTWADGMVGVLPVFSNKRKAQRYARRPGKEPFRIITVEEPDHA